MTIIGFKAISLWHTEKNTSRRKSIHAGTAWKGAGNSPLVNKALTNNISNALRYFPQIAPYLQWGGYACGLTGIGFSGRRFWDACQNDDGLGMLDSGIDVIMGGVGFVPGYSWAVSGGYFLLKPLVKKHAETVLKSQIETGVAGLPATLPFK